MEGIAPYRGIGVGGRGGGWVDRAHVERDPDSSCRGSFAKRLDGSTVCDQEMLAYRKHLPKVLDPGGMDPGQVTERRDAPRLVVRHPERDAIAESVEHHARVVAEP